ncbi:MAG: hypothetical protein R3D30_00385 [Hyphomicrobiales bacterium]
MAAAEHYQGAALAGDTASQALQEAAFNSALSQYAVQKQVAGAALAAFLPELAASLTDVDLSTDTTLAGVQTYYAGLSDPATEDPFLASWLDQFVASFPALSSEGSDAALQALAAIAAATPSGLTGSARSPQLPMSRIIWSRTLRR